MSAHRSAKIDRIVRLELLRARAAYERASLKSRATELADACDPRQWFGRVGSGRSGGVLLQGLEIAQRYPFILSTLTSLVLGKRWQWLKLTGAAVATVAALLTRLSSQAGTQPGNPDRDR